MTAQEWLEDYEYWDPKTQPDDVNTAATIIRDQQERIERLEAAVERACEELLYKCPEYRLNGDCIWITENREQNCIAHWRKWLMEDK